MSATEWWDTSSGLTTNSWTGTIAGTVLSPSGKGVPVSSTTGVPARTLLNFWADKGLRTPFTPGYSSIFAGNCSLVLCARMSAQNQYLVQFGRNSAWNVSGNGMCGLNVANNQITAQLYNGATVTTGLTAGAGLTPSWPVFLVLRKVGQTVQVLALLGPSDTIQKSSISALGPALSDAQFFSVGNPTSYTPSSIPLEVVCTGFFPYALSENQIIELRGAVLPMTPPYEISGLVEWWDPTYGVANTVWAGRQHGKDMQKVVAGHPNLAVRRINGKPWVHLQGTVLGVTREQQFANQYNGPITIVGERIANTNPGNLAPFAVGDWGSGLGNMNADGIAVQAYLQNPTSVTLYERQMYYPVGGSGQRIQSRTVAGVGPALGVAVIDTWSRSLGDPVYSTYTLKYERTDNISASSWLYDNGVGYGAFRMNWAYDATTSGDVDMGHHMVYNRQLEPWELLQLRMWIDHNGSYANISDMRGFGTFTPRITRSVPVSAALTALRSGMSADLSRVQQISIDLHGGSSLTGDLTFMPYSFMRGASSISADMQVQWAANSDLQGSASLSAIEAGEFQCDFLGSSSFLAPVLDKTIGLYAELVGTSRFTVGARVVATPVGGGDVEAAPTQVARRGKTKFITEPIKLHVLHKDPAVTGWQPFKGGK